VNGRNPIRLLAAIIVLMMAVAHSMSAQEALTQQLRMAQTYERSGDLRNAARIYQELYAKRPESRIYFDGVARTLVGLQQYEALIPLVIERVEKEPSTELAVLAGALSWKTGKTAEAERWWNKALDIGGNDEETYVALANVQSELLIPKLAIASYLKARERSGTTDAYASELAALYASTGDYRNGVREVIAEYRSSDDIQHARGKLSAFMLTPEGISYVKTVLEADATTGVQGLRLKQWFYRETRDWRAALAITRELDAAGRQRGQELIQFADGARQDGQYDIALEAYGAAMEGRSNDPMALTALYGYARTLEQRMRLSEGLSKDDARKILDRYGSIVKTAPTNPFAADALYHMAIITDEVMGDQDGARDILQRLINGFRGTQPAADGVLYLASLYIVAGQSEAAATLLKALASLNIPSLADKRDVANFRRAELYFQQHRLDSALALYSAVSARPGSAAANDALDKLMLVQVAEQDTALLWMYADAEALSAQRKGLEAAAAFVRAADIANIAEIKDRCLYEAGVRYVAAGHDAEAVPVLQRLMERIPETIYGDRAMLLVAGIQERQGDRTGAITTLTNLLVQYPRSILLPEARERIRRLRGDA